MNYLLDTNVLSEPMRPRPHRRVKDWVEAVPDSSLYISVLSVGEIRRGVEELPAGPRRTRLATWLETELPEWFEGRLLPVTVEVADRWGRLLAEAGHPVPGIDSLLAATALQHGLTLVTRNVDDFRYPSLPVLNPWAV